MRPLNEVEKKVLRVAVSYQANKSTTWGGPNLLFYGWEGVKTYRCKELGISSAIQMLKRRGLVEPWGWHSYRLTTEGVKIANRLSLGMETQS